MKKRFVIPDEFGHFIILMAHLHIIFRFPTVIYRNDSLSNLSAEETVYISRSTFYNIWLQWSQNGFLITSGAHTNQRPKKLLHSRSRKIDNLLLLPVSLFFFFSPRNFLFL